MQPTKCPIMTGGGRTAHWPAQAAPCGGTFHGENIHSGSPATLSSDGDGADGDGADSDGGAARSGSHGQGCGGRPGAMGSGSVRHERWRASACQLRGKPSSGGLAFMRACRDSLGGSRKATCSMASLKRSCSHSTRSARVVCLWSVFQRTGPSRKSRARRVTSVSTVRAGPFGRQFWQYTSPTLIIGKRPGRSGPDASESRPTMSWRCLRAPRKRSYGLARSEMSVSSESAL